MTSERLWKLITTPDKYGISEKPEKKIKRKNPGYSVRQKDTGKETITEDSCSELDENKHMKEKKK